MGKRVVMKHRIYLLLDHTRVIRGGIACFESSKLLDFPFCSQRSGFGHQLTRLGGSEMPGFTPGVPGWLRRDLEQGDEKRRRCCLRLHRH